MSTGCFVCIMRVVDGARKGRKIPQDVESFYEPAVKEWRRVARVMRVEMVKMFVARLMQFGPCAWC